MQDLNWWHVVHMAHHFGICEITLECHVTESVATINTATLDEQEVLGLMARYIGTQRAMFGLPDSYIMQARLNVPTIHLPKT